MVCSTFINMIKLIYLEIYCSYHQSANKIEGELNSAICLNRSVMILTHWRIFHWKINTIPEVSGINFELF